MTYKKRISSGKSGNRHGLDWNEDEEAKLIGLRAAGALWREIGVALGRSSRQCCSKSRRIGEKKTGFVKKARTRLGMDAEVIAFANFLAAPPPPAFDQFKIEDLRPESCRFSTGRLDDRFVFCGRLANDGKWCELHHNIVYDRATEVQNHGPARQTA
jgi:hypothetical protein